MSSFFLLKKGAFRPFEISDQLSHIYERHMHTYLFISLHARSPLVTPIVTVTNIIKHVPTLKL